MKRLILLVLAGVMLSALVACGSEEAASVSDRRSTDKGTYQTISPQDAKALFDEGRPVTLIDVRTEDEYKEGHIPGAVNIPNEDIEKADLNGPKDNTIIVYCRSGRRSREAAEKLLKMGYDDVRDLGGITDWPYDTVEGDMPGKWTSGATDDDSGSDANPDSNSGQNPKSSSDGVLSSFSGTDLDGNAVDATVLADSDLTMINVWATYCGPCLREMPDLGELAAEYKDKGVQIIGVVSDVLNSDGSLSESQLKTASDIVTSTKADYLHIVPSRDLMGILSQINSVPTTFFVDKDGKQVGEAYIGSKSKADWEKIIDETLEEISK